MELLIALLTAKSCLWNGRSTVKEYDVVMKKLAIRIVSLLVEGLGVKPWHFATYLDGMEAALRWNYQPPSPKPEKAVGCSPHTNPYLITLQHDSGTGGLQVERDGKWFGVPLRADALIVNVGDAFQVSNISKYCIVEAAVCGDLSECCLLKYEDNAQIILAMAKLSLEFG